MAFITLYSLIRLMAGSSPRSLPMAPADKPAVMSGQAKALDTLAGLRKLEGLAVSLSSRTPPFNLAGNIYFWGKSSMVRLKKR